MKAKRVAAYVLAVVLMLTGCSGNTSEAQASVQSVAMLTGAEISGANQYNGVAEARGTVKVQKDANKAVKECYVEAGDQVEEGQRLFSYDTDALELTVSSAELEVEQLRNTITNYQTQITSLEREKKSASSADKLSYTLQIQEAELNKSETEYNLKQKEAELTKLKDSIEETDVFSTVDGVVQSVQKDNASGGTDLSGGAEGGDAYITIMETGTYRIRGTAGEESIRGITEGMEMTAYSRQDGEKRWHGVVESINTGSAENQNSSNNGNYYDGSNGEGSSKYVFYVALDSSDGLLIGQHVYLKPGNGDQDDNALRLSAGYLVMENDQASVWAANGRDKLEKRSVTLGEYNEETDEYVIASGLSLQDYIAFPDESLHEGMDVVRYDENSFSGGDAGEGGLETYVEEPVEGAFPEGDAEVFPDKEEAFAQQDFPADGEVYSEEDFPSDGEVYGDGAEVDFADGVVFDGAGDAPETDAGNAGD